MWYIVFGYGSGLEFAENFCTDALKSLRDFNIQGVIKNNNLMKKITIGVLGLVLTSAMVWSAASLEIIKQPESQAVTVGESVTSSVETDVELAMSMVWCPAGTFTMGSPSSELGRESDETLHSVTISHGFWIGKYEVTQAQYRVVMGSNSSSFKGDNLPVEEVAWYDAMEFCQKLTEIERATGRLPENYAYTLPTEAQWEYACRAGTTTALNSGKNVTTAEDEGICDNLDEVGWYWMNGGKKNWNEGKDPAICTHPGGQKKPNQWGIYDMHGNVWEWCLDWYGSYPTSPVTDPKGPGTGSYRVLRGGSWYYGADYCRSAYRGNGRPSGNNLVNIGFRVALVPVQ